MALAAIAATCIAPPKPPPQTVEAEPQPPPPLPACPEFDLGQNLGTVVSPEVLEASGMAISRKNPGILWTHNDSGDRARLLALRTNGEYVGELAIAGVTAVDFEDLGLGAGPKPGEWYLYVGDIGDNYRVREHVVVYRVPEPELPAEGWPVHLTVPGKAIQVRYPSGPLDSETLMVDGARGDLYIVSKDAVGAVNTVYRLPAPHEDGEPVTAEPVATIHCGLTTAGDISPDGREVVIKTYDVGYLWRRRPGEPLPHAFDSEPCRIPLQQEAQGEALAFAPDGSGYYTLGEGYTQPIYFFGRRHPATARAVCPAGTCPTP